MIDVKDLLPRSQLGQDLWVAMMTAGRKDGWFVEIGAADGVDLSNTYMLEKELGWRGVCAEPNPAFFAHLKNARSAVCVQMAVYPTGGRVLEFIPNGVLGTLAEHAESDMHATTRRDFDQLHGRISVETISPEDLMVVGGLPNDIDYLSLDTEGSEWDILSAIDLTNRRFGLVTVEHNHVTDKRNAIRDYLHGHDFLVIDAGIDDWFYHPQLLSKLNGGRVVDIGTITELFSAKLKNSGWI
jgi:FkbM family methyltransferase